MSDWDKDPHEGTIWAKDPHRGTVWSNNPHEGTILDNRYDVRQPEQSIPVNETWTQRIERARSEGRNQSLSRSNSKGGSRFGVIIIFLVFFAMATTYGHNALADVIKINTIKSEPTGNFLQNWLSLIYNIFLPISTIILFVSLLVRRFWTGAIIVIATGILSFVGTGIYLVITRVFFGN